MDILTNKEGTKIVSTDQIKQTEFFPIYLEHLESGKTDFTQRSSYPIYAYMFNMSSSGTVSHYETLDFDSIIDRMIRYSSSLGNDFYEKTRFLPWLRKQRMFFEYAFFSSDLYVNWDGDEEKYSFFIRLSENTYDPKDLDKKDDKYLNIETNETVIFSDPEQELVKYSGNGRKENRFRQGFKLAYQMEVRESIYNTQCLLGNKKLLIKADGYSNANKTTLNAVKKDLVNLAPFLNKTDHQSIIDFLEVPIVTAVELETFLKTAYTGLDREISEFGRVANLNAKPERKTAGENYIAIDRQVDHLRSIQDQLDLLSGDMEERGGPKLVFKVNTEKDLGMVDEPEGDQMPTEEDATKSEDENI